MDDNSKIGYYSVGITVTEAYNKLMHEEYIVRNFGLGRYLGEIDEYYKSENVTLSKGKLDYFLCTGKLAESLRIQLKFKGSTEFEWSIEDIEKEDIKQDYIVMTDDPMEAKVFTTLSEAKKFLRNRMVMRQAINQIKTRERVEIRGIVTNKIYSKLKWTKVRESKQILKRAKKARGVIFPLNIFLFKGKGELKHRRKG